MTSLLGKASQLLNRAPVPYAGRQAGRAWISSWGRGSMTSQLEMMRAVSTLFSIVNRTSNAFSQVDWHLYRKTIDSRRVYEGQEIRTEVTRHAVLDLLAAPNDFMTGQEFREAGQQHVELAGESDIVVVRDGLGLDLPLALWPVRPDRMEPVPHPTEFLAGWIYTGPNGEQVPLRREDVIQVKMPNPLDPYRGLSPVAAAMIDLGSARAAAEWNAAFFKNSAEPGGIVEVDRRLSDTEFTEMQTRWRESHQGISNAHRVAILEQGTWKSNAYSMRDLQFAELRKLSSEMLMEAFGIHPHMLGKTQDVNKANADAAETSFARWLVTPRCVRWKGVLNTRLLPMYGATATGLELDHDRVVPDDREADDRERTSKASAASTLVRAGWDAEAVLETVGLPPMTHTGTVAPERETTAA